MGRGRSKRTGVKRVSSTSYEVSFSYEGKRQRPKVVCDESRANEQRLINFRQEILYQIKEGTFNYAEAFPDCPNKHKFLSTSTVKFSEYVKGWYESYKHNYANSSQAKNHNIVHNQIIKHLGKHRIGDLKWKHVKHWLQSSPQTTKTISNKLTLLNIALEEAVDEELITTNPIRGKTLKGNVPSKKQEKIDPFSTQQIAKILDSCIYEQDKNLFAFAFGTGLRTSELIALEWSDFDEDERYVKVKRKRTAEDKIATYTKTDAGYRTVKLNDIAFDAIMSQREYTVMMSKEVFYNRATNKPFIGDRPVREHWKVVLKRAKVRYRYPYQTRHTFATLSLMAGENLGWLSKTLGHTDASFTLRTYTDWIESDAPEAGNKVSELFKKVEKKSKVVNL